MNPYIHYLISLPGMLPKNSFGRAPPKQACISVLGREGVKLGLSVGGERERVSCCIADSILQAKHSLPLLTLGTCILVTVLTIPSSEARSQTLRHPPYSTLYPLAKTLSNRHGQQQSEKAKASKLRDVLKLFVCG